MGRKRDLILIVAITLLFINYKGCAIITFKIEKPGLKKMKRKLLMPR